MTLRYRNTPHAPCRHLLPATGATVSVECTSCGGKKSTAVHTIHACAALGECLPTFVCTNANKQAVREEWARSDGGDAYALHPCRGCEKFSPSPPAQP